MLEQEELDDLLNASTPVLAQVYPALEAKVRNVIKDLAAQDLAFAAFMGLRTFAEQDALYARGRTATGKVITDAKGGQSWHNFGLAVDLVEDGDVTKKGIQWSWKKNLDYLKIGTACLQWGLEWGGWWKAFADVPHVQLTAKMTLNEANLLYQTGGTIMVWAEIDRRLAEGLKT